jgi:hypothetical protein
MGCFSGGRVPLRLRRFDVFRQTADTHFRKSQSVLRSLYLGVWFRFGFQFCIVTYTSRLALPVPGTPFRFWFLCFGLGLTLLDFLNEQLLFDKKFSVFSHFL